MVVMIFLVSQRTARGAFISPVAMSSGGIHGQGTTTMMEAMFGDPLDGQCQGVGTVVYGGNVGQLCSPVTLTAQAPLSGVPETTACQLSATSANDDGSYSTMDVAWTVMNGPIVLIDSNGMALAGAVYQDTFATVRAASGSLSATTGVTVVDTLRDNFGLYAGDGVADSWQVQYFGTNNVNGMATAEPNGNGQNNYTAFMAGTCPTNAMDVFRVQSILRGTGGMDLVLTPAFSNRTYHIEACANLRAPDWIQVATSVGPAQLTQLAVNNVAATNRVQFYRASIDYAW